MIMRKLLIIFALLGIVLVSGCTGTSPTGMAITENQDNGVQYYQDVCRQDTDCVMVYCSETPEDIHCMCTADMLQEFKCYEKGRVISVRDPDVCGCVDGICR